MDDEEMKMLDKTIENIEVLIDCLITGTVNDDSYEFCKEGMLNGLSWFEKKYEKRKDDVLRYLEQRSAPSDT